MIQKDTNKVMQSGPISLRHRQLMCTTLCYIVCTSQYAPRTCSPFEVITETRAAWAKPSFAASSQHVVTTLMQAASLPQSGHGASR